MITNVLGIESPSRHSPGSETANPASLGFPFPSPLQALSPPLPQEEKRPWSRPGAWEVPVLSQNLTYQARSAMGARLTVPLEGAGLVQAAGDTEGAGTQVRLSGPAGRTDQGFPFMLQRWNSLPARGREEFRQCSHPDAAAGFPRPWEREDVAQHLGFHYLKPRYASGDQRSPGCQQQARHEAGAWCNSLMSLWEWMGRWTEGGRAER